MFTTHSSVNSVTCSNGSECFQVALASDAVRETISDSTPGSAAVLLASLVEDVKLRDRAHFASLAIRTLHSLLVHCGIKTVRTPTFLHVHYAIQMLTI